MKLRRLHVRSAPGLPRGIEPLEPADGVTVVVGANGAGKTTLCRAIRAALWPEAGEGALDAVSHWTDPGRELTAETSGGRTRWRDEAGREDAPRLPEAHLARCWTLELTDLVSDGDGTDGRIAREIGVQLHGGYDLREVTASRFSVRPRHGHSELRQLEAARHASRAVRLEQERLAVRERELPELRRRQREASEAGRRLPLVERALDLARARAQRHDVDRALSELPSALARVVGDEVERLDALDREIGEREETRRAARGARRDAERAAAEAADGLGGAPPPDELVAAWRTRVTEVRRRESELEAATTEAAVARRRAREERAGLGFATPGDEDPKPFPPGLRDAALKLVRDEGELATRHGVLAEQVDITRFRAPDRSVAWVALVSSLVLLAGLAAAWFAGFLPVPAAAAGVAGSVALLVVAFVALGVPHRRRRLELAGLERRRRRLVERGRELELERARLAERLGLLPGTAPVGISDAAGALSRAREQIAAAAQADELAGRLSADVERDLARATRELVLAGHVTSITDGAALAARIEAIDRAVREHRSAAREAARAADAVAAADRELARVRERRAELYARLELEDGDRDGLRALLAELDAWRAAREERTGLEREIREHEAKLSGHPDLRDADATALEKERSRLAERSSGLEAIVGTIAGLEKEIDLARATDTLADARAAEADARDLLDARRREALRAEAGRFLLESVESEYEQSSRPAVLERAASLFAGFTDERYALGVVSDDEGATLVARDRDAGETRLPQELSDGTRVQLQLAARLAFASHVERGDPIPLLLDEAIATSDDTRFDAVAAALFDLSREGRQVIYFTSNRADLARWQAAAQAAGVAAPAVLTLAGEGAAAPAAPRRLEIPKDAAIPAPFDGESPAVYAARLRVAAPDPLAAGRAHAYWAVPDDAELLHALLVAGVRTIGRLESARARLLGDLRDAGERLDRARAGAALARETIEAWRVGRGRRLSLTDLEACPAVTDEWLARFRPLLDEIDGRAERFLRAFDHPRPAATKGYRTNKVGELRQWLREQGHVDERAVLDADAIRQRVAERLPRETPLARTEIAERVTWLLGALDGGEPTGRGEDGADPPDRPATGPERPGRRRSRSPEA